MIQILNDDPLPSVSLATRRNRDRRGHDRNGWHCRAGNAGQRGDESTVWQVTGDALISLYQDGDQLAARGSGTYTVDLGDSTSTVLTIRADEDESLADNQTKTATVTIVDAGGADIGDRDTLTVTVRGSTAVPVLPTIGQLLLTVLLLAGGLRLHSTRTRTARRL